MFMLNDTPLALDTAFTVGEGDEAIQYPANWLRLASPEERAAIGITEAADPEAYDDRLYWGVGNPKQLDDEIMVPDEGEAYTQKGLKSQWVAQVKDTTNKLLSATDWMVIRKVERGIDLPTDTFFYRAAVIAECARIEAAINACTTVDELAAIQPNWPQAV